jgi:lipid II:glycine glycyltransferase (peptidoglycan interpeptide bridge formation enzyme)
MSQTTHTPYFTQTKRWSEFWVEGNKDNHYVHELVIKGQITYVYQYPWFFGKNFLYVPSGPVVQPTLSETNAHEFVSEFFRKLKATAEELQSVFVKFEFDPYLSHVLKIHSYQEAQQFLKNSKPQPFHDIQPARKRIMYSATILLDTSLSTLPVTKGPEYYSEFMSINSTFWKDVNSGHRSKTKKSIAEKWKFSLDKTPANFEHFWNIYTTTSKRQQFATQPKEYFEKLYYRSNSRIIVLFSDDNTPEAVWFGYLSETSLIYLYGGNTEYSMKHYGQYFIHLLALEIATKERKDAYDLGGYDPNVGYGVFKERYKGTVVSFLGPFDLIVKPLDYKIIQKLVSSVKLIKGAFR